MFTGLKPDFQNYINNFKILSSEISKYKIKKNTSFYTFMTYIIKHIE
jgi:hypothetical protein